MEEIQHSLLRRFAKSPRPPEPIIYEFTDDRALLHQYYDNREIMYRKVFNTDRFVGKEDFHDKISHILIARRGKLCVGGCRLTIRESDEKFMLPMENPEFNLIANFPNLPLHKMRHGEISRFAVLDSDVDKLAIMRMLYQLISEKCQNSGLGAVFYKAPLPMSRNWRKIGQSCGLKRIRICTEIKVPENPIHPEIIWYVSEVILPPAEMLMNEMNLPLPNAFEKEESESSVVH